MQHTWHSSAASSSPSVLSQVHTSRWCLAQIEPEHTWPKMPVAQQNTQFKYKANLNIKQSWNKSATIPTYPVDANLCIRIARGEVFLWFRGGTQSSGSIAIALFRTVRVRSATFSGAFKRACLCATRPLAGTVALQPQITNQRLTNEPHWHQYLEKRILKNIMTHLQIWPGCSLHLLPSASLAL